MFTDVVAKGRSTFDNASRWSSTREIFVDSSIVMVITNDPIADCKTIIFPENISEYLTDPKSNNVD